MIVYRPDLQIWFGFSGFLCQMPFLTHGTFKDIVHLLHYAILEGDWHNLVIAPQTSQKHEHRVCLALLANLFHRLILLPHLQWSCYLVPAPQLLSGLRGRRAHCTPSLLLLTSSSSPPSGAGPLWASWKRIFFIFRYWRLSSSRTASLVRAIRSITTVIGRSLHRKWCCAYREVGVKGQSGWAAQFQFKNRNKGARATGSAWPMNSQSVFRRASINITATDHKLCVIFIKIFVTQCSDERKLLFHRLLPTCSSPAQFSSHLPPGVAQAK